MAKVKWESFLDQSTQRLVGIHDSQGALNIRNEVEDWPVREIRKSLKQLDDEITRLEGMETAIISTKKQIKQAVFDLEQ